MFKGLDVGFSTCELIIPVPDFRSSKLFLKNQVLILSIDISYWYLKTRLNPRDAILEIALSLDTALPSTGTIVLNWSRNGRPAKRAD